MPSACPRGRISLVEHPSGDILVSEAREPQGGQVHVFDSSGNPLATWEGANTPSGHFGTLVRIAADSSTGEVYVSDTRGNHVIDVFDSSGAYLCQITGAGASSTSATECDTSAPGVPGGSLQRPGVATIDPQTGQLYVTDGLGGGGDEHAVIDVFSASGAFESQIDGSDTPQGFLSNNSAFYSIAFDGKSSDLLFARR